MGFVEYIMEEITEQWCVDLDQIHMTGISNGGMFTYYIASNALDGLGTNIQKITVVTIRHIGLISRWF